MILNLWRAKNLERLARALLVPVDAAWLSALRIGLGVLLAISMARFLAYGWVDRLFVDPDFHFKYWGFHWIEPLPAPAMHGLFWLLLLASVTMALGLCFRLSALVLAAGLTYVQLIDVSTYLNHYYLAALLVWLLALSPAARLWSLDAWLGRQRGAAPGHTSVARGWLYLFRFQIGLVYTFAGLAKAQSDWLLHAQPLRIWLGSCTDLPILGPLFTLEGVPLSMSWAGFLFDTTIALWLSLRRTRRWAFALLVVFHALTRLLLPIGMFPFIMVTAASVFFLPGWPRALVARLARRVGRFSVARPTQPSTRVPTLVHERVPARVGWKARGLVLLGLAYCLVQLGLPLRHLAYGGNVLWHEQGMRFSWRVMVRAKGGNTRFIVQQRRTGQTWHVSPRRYLTAMQEMEMSGQPDLILQLARHVRRDLTQKGLGPVDVRVDARVALNGRRSRRFIDPNRNLAELSDGFGKRDWVLPGPSGPPPHTRPVL